MNSRTDTPLTPDQVRSITDYLRRAWFGVREYEVIHVDLGRGLCIELNHSEKDVLEIDVSVYELHSYHDEQPPKTLAGIGGEFRTVATLLEGAVATTFNSSKGIQFKLNPVLSRPSLGVYSAHLPLRDFPASNVNELLP